MELNKWAGLLIAKGSIGQLVLSCSVLKVVSVDPATNLPRCLRSPGFRQVGEGHG